jgi:hypothetical protein
MQDDLTFEDAVYDMLSTALYVREIAMREYGFIPAMLADVMAALGRVELAAPGTMLAAASTVREVVDSLYDERGRGP